MHNENTERPRKRVIDSALVTSYLMMPQDANPHGNVYGGTIMRYVDGLAGAVAERHSRTNSVTASIDRMDFFKPVYVGDMLTLKASVNFTRRTSMEIGVRIESENLGTGEVTHTGSSYLTYVALDRDGKPTTVPMIVPESENEKRRYLEGELRSKKRSEKSQDTTKSK